MVPYNLTDPKKQIQYLANTRLNLAQQREQLDLLRDLNQMYVDRLHGGAGTRGDDPVDGGRVPDADRGSGGIRHAQGEPGDDRQVRRGRDSHEAV